MRSQAWTKQDTGTCDAGEENSKHKPVPPHNRDPCLKQECAGVGIQGPTPSVQRGLYSKGDHIAGKRISRRSEL